MTGIKQYIKQLECAVCLDTCVDPRALTCPGGVHTMCSGCLEGLVRGSTLTCPLCRTNHAVPATGVAGFPRNLMAAGMIDTLCGGCRKAEPETNCSHCDKAVCLRCKISHMSFEEAGQWLEERNVALEESIEVGKLTNVQQANVVCDQIDVAEDILIAKVEERTKVLKEEVMISFKVEEGSFKLWKEQLDKVIDEAQQYLDITRSQLGQMYDDRFSDQELLDIKAWCQDKVSAMTVSIKQTPSVPDLVLQYDATAAIAAIQAFGSIVPAAATSWAAAAATTEATPKTTAGPTARTRGKSGRSRAMATKAKNLKYGKPRVVGEKGQTTGQFDRPTDVAVCPMTGHVIVSDAGNQRLQILDANMAYVTDTRRSITDTRRSITDTRRSVTDTRRSVTDTRRSWRWLGLDWLFGLSTNSRGEREPELEYPWSVSANSRGEIIVTDFFGDAVHVYTKDGAYSRQLPGPWRRPLGVTVGDDDSTYVCNAATSTIRVIDKSGQVLRTFGGHGTRTGEFTSEPRYITLCDGHVYVSDDAGCVHKFTKSGSFIKLLDQSVVGVARGLAVLGSQDLVIVREDGLITVVRDDRVLCHVGERGNEPYHLKDPWGVAVSKTGQIIVADFGNHNILVYDPSK